ncbi:hypothetical protein G7054_g4335 [Neopestalotiopsis clavispora]|nr:hypothetical protein G7054_g4335 [Neopestalotiopsis clavispora]
MTVDDFNAVVQPKVQGTLNLDACFDDGLDFCVMLSSISGIIGNASQAAYRKSLGRPAVTIDLGVVLGVDYLAENQELASAMRRQGFSGTTERELMALLNAAISNPHRGQIVTGLGLWIAASSLSNFASPLFANFCRMAERVPGSGEVEQAVASSFRVIFAPAKSADERAEAICTALVGQISALGMIPRENISADRPMSEYGY